MVRRDEAVNFLATGTLHLFNGLMPPWNNISSYMKNLHGNLKQYAKALNLGINMTFPKNKDPKHSAKSEEKGLWTTM